jgi:hypothetical protein
MSAVSYFQKFAQKENHVTNNTLLVLRHLYRASPRKVSLLLNALFEEDVPIGLEFQQQIKAAHSVPDALIKQQPLSLFLEAKLGGALNRDQIERHLNSIKALHLPLGSAILIGLTSEQLPVEQLESLKAKAEAEGVRFYSVTYSDLASELRKLCAEYEQDLLEVIEDYEAFLNAEGLIANPYRRLVVFPCGFSWAENIRFGAYYEPPSRSDKFHCRFLGIYRHKAISHVGKIEAAAICTITEGRLQVLTQEYGEFTERHRARIQQMIEATPYYDLASEPHRYYVVDGFIATDFRKISSGGIRGHRYFDLGDYSTGRLPGPRTTTDDVAAMLNQQTFE